MKTDLLVCSNKGCKVRTSAPEFSGRPRFTVTLEVTADGQVISDVHDIADDCFRCVYCGANATSEEVQPLNDDTGSLSPEETAFESYR